MKLPAILLLMASALCAQCPLGLTPEEACNADNPLCALFSDGDADGLCDNPGPQEQPAEEEPEEIDEPEPEPEIIEEEVTADPFCPLNLSPSQACNQENARCTFYTDSNRDGLCDNPGLQPAVSVEETEQAEEEQPEPSVEPAETEVEITEPDVEEETSFNQDPAEAVPVDCPLGFSLDEACHAEDPLCALFRDQNENGICDNAIEEAEDDIEPEYTSSSQRQYTCPLNYSAEEACLETSPQCTLYMDSDGDGRCDNPGTTCTLEDSTCGLQTPSLVGCPLGLPPEGACPDSLALCPHWFGVTHHTTCSNPAGGNRRINIILITLGVFLPLSTWLSRRFYGRRLKDRLRRNSAHHILRGASLMILGFGVQGCFCPLGTFQYAFTSEGLTFLGLSGFLIFLLPLVFSAFFGRIFCGWVCPMGAVQEFLYSIHIPGRFSPSGKLHNKLKYLSTFILIALIAVILLDRFGVVSLKWSAPFCAIDPFHTIFTLFLSGNMIIAGVTIILAIFIRRFFCRYFCFYGAAQSLFAKLTLWNRIKGIREKEPEMHSDEEFDK
ncbi:MAG: 4Fe-4S binding protein [Candidatus Sabulitectum sp.]|nr:4Fe-4S binding protein [Candidatus Sabulitectum sp.]